MIFSLRSAVSTWTGVTARKIPGSSDDAMICEGAGQAAVTKTNDGWKVCFVQMNDVEKAVCTPRFPGKLARLT